MREIPVNEGTLFAKKLQIGWNLGNTFDGFVSDDQVAGAGLGCESAWVGIRTTREMIQAVKDAGFQTIRIPVSWHSHLEPDLTIKTRWMDRVQEVVDDAISLGLYVILNIHHDNDKNCKYYFYPDSEHKEQSVKYIRAIWSQVAERFKDYDEHLIFESLNEPRLIGTSVEWNLAESEQCHDACTVISVLNQVFVDAVRNFSTQNKTRFLLIPGYAGSVPGAMREEFVLPQDILPDHLMVETHAYSPYPFALQADGPNHFGKPEEEFIENMFAELYERFISKGIPVVMDEFGVRNKNNHEDRIRFTQFYIEKAREVQIPCVWWDNNIFTGDGEQFGLLARASVTWKYPEIVDAMVKQFRNEVTK